MSAEERYRKLVVLWHELLQLDTNDETSPEHVRADEILVEVIILLGVGTFSTQISNVVKDIVKAYEYDDSAKRPLRARAGLDRDGA